ncbi:CerR family C-terminal domain-containing protein [Phyllobacterium zundukense]|uniref:CerR family C-terminal domain-containing protein n=1 Tax=Phyllobacterium zundukense TaxID=1867719 RepID=A0ACD4D4L4_9HYPH|nr:CerR family C-terminal domain-containing protein [Phyllobacterium zundukense]UXN60719.1 CerR family C-terminal domain-containing protein [Phyllobacterium zundukense]
MARKTPRKLPGRREDGATTKAQILEAAGEVFAEKGFDRATGKEIAERAGSNSAAVNYYYGGIEGLYADVLVEAHRRLLTYDKLLALAESPGEPTEKLKILIGLIARRITGPESSSWALRVLSREILSPSSVFPVLVKREILPKKLVVTGIIGEILDRPHDDPVVTRCTLNIIAPFAMLLVGNKQIFTQVLPGFNSGEPEVQEQIVEHFQRFALAGLAATAAALQSDDH